ncbi:hypothetical protein C3B79_3051 [Aeromonas hydrophila]|nr:hypothetical protein C3B79_3051 [Aeromonas hydrophila]
MFKTSHLQPILLLFNILYGGRKCSVSFQKAPIDTSSSFSTAYIPSKNSDK